MKSVFKEDKNIWCRTICHEMKSRFERISNKFINVFDIQVKRNQVIVGVENLSNLRLQAGLMKRKSGL